MASIQYLVSATDAASAVFKKIALSADGLDKQLADLSKRVATPEVDLKDAKFTLGMVNAAKRLDKLSAMVADPSVELDAAKAQTEILRITAMLDRLDGKKVTAHVSVDGGRGGGSIDKLLAALTPGAGGAATGLGMAGAGAASATIVGPLLIGVSQVIGALAAAGAGVTAFAALSIPQFTAVSGAVTQIRADTNAYERATTAAGRATALKRIKKDWADISPPQRQAVRGVQALGAEFSKLSGKLAPITFKVFNDGLKIANQLLPDLLPFARTAGTAIDGLLKSLDKFVTPAAGTGLTGKMATLFKAPPTGFQKFLTTLQALSGPAITALGKGLGQIAGAVGNLLIVSASPDSIRTLSRVLGFMAATINGVAWAVNRASGNMQKWVDIAHQTAGKFDEFRHDMARMFAAIATLFDTGRHNAANWGHDVAHTFDTLRHSIAVTWNAIWAATIGAQIRALNTIVSWFRGLPARALGALRGFGHSLYAFGHAALTEFLNGLKSIGGSVLGYLKNFIGGIPHAIMSFLHMSPPHAGSVFYDLGANLMRHLGAGIKSTAHHAVSAAQGAVGAVSGALGGDALANQALARSIFPWPASQWMPFVNLVMAESGFNRFARNPTSGAYGIAQALPPTKYPFAGQAAGGSHAGPQLSWMFNYIAQRYGTPAGAWAHELSAHWYDTGGWLPPGVSVAVNKTGQPERVLPPGGGGVTINNNFGPGAIRENVDLHLLAQRQGFQITAAGFGS